MADLQLSLACSDNPRTRPIIDGLVQPDGIDLRVTVIHPSEMFWRQLHFAEFDVSEMSMSSLLMSVAHGDTRWVAVPVFTSRRFFHTGVLARTDSGIDKPQDLVGKRVGVPEYQQTAALWTRAALQHVYGVKAQDMEWWMERNPEMSHGGATGFQPPEGVRLHYIPPEKSIASMLLDHELDASALFLIADNLVDRSRVDVTKDPRIKRLFPDQVGEGQAYYQKTGFYPINHGVVVQRKVVEPHPWVVLNVFNMFAKAKEIADARAREGMDPYLETGLIPREVRQTIARDPMPYGVRANRDILTAITQFSNEQGLTPRVLGLEEIFAPQTMDL
ncbi:MAG: 4,5-dihydroxyphthalate decarboxylase [Chloroflexota bacterium]|jgi:4,5-dihydroxyphthalate decarboxylase|nr:4,5-dihydroxyphthalate decarboxylase [Chloroflexota bacterium]